LETTGEAVPGERLNSLAQHLRSLEREARNFCAPPNLESPEISVDEGGHALCSGGAKQPKALGDAGSSAQQLPKERL
jgi:hypothetical protein